MQRSGPLAGVRVLEVAAIGPVPFAGMILSDLGADVVRIDRTRPDPASTWSDPRMDVLGRGRRSLALDLKTTQGAEVLLRLAGNADVLLEGFRPGVAERLGIGPDACLQRNPRLVYGRMTGWGQQGPLSAAAGHDINYIALTGALHAVGGEGAPPSPPLNLVGDFGGGALYLVVGVLSALIERQRSGKGDVIDAAMIDGAASLMSIFYVMEQIGFWRDERATNFLDGGAHFYGTYETSDGRYVAIGAIEPRFYDELLARLGIDGADLPAQHDRDGWKQARARLAAVFRTRTRAQWCELLEGTDACFAPVLSIGEAATHPHLRERGTILDVGGVRQPAPAPRFARSACERPQIAPRPGADTAAVLREGGFSAGEIDALRSAGVIGGEAV
ncbi:MAG TPA: CaiB/BaiF CoA-transferase family protein [Candidatus Limnocylindrales bacterium]|nr:CaiB/BaiF CoA-transferase family protein [Candidatus Limnocylindrales bacterium]